MAKAVDTIEFWRERIKTAEEDRLTVFITDRSEWNKINKFHRYIFNKEVEKGAKVLDAGCGYGRWSVFFKEHDYLGVDFSPDFINMADKKYPTNNFMVGDLKKLPFEDGEFDVAFCVSMKQMVRANLGEEVWEEMFEELKRVSNKLLILEYGEAEKYESWERGAGNTTGSRHIG